MASGPLLTVTKNTVRNLLKRNLLQREIYYKEKSSLSRLFRYGKERERNSKIDSI